MKTVDVCVIGAGPAGASAALHLAKSGIKCLVLEKETFPRDKVCGDALSGKVVNELKRIDPNLVNALGANKHVLGSNGVSFFAPNGKALRVPFSKKQSDRIAPGFIAKRLDFDQFLFNRLNEIEVWQDTVLRKAEYINGGIRLFPADREEVHSKIVLDASGANSWFSRHFAGLTVDPKHHCAGVRAYYKGVSDLDDEGFIELHFIKEALPGYFWIFPLPNGAANVGLGVRSDLVRKRRIDVKQLLQVVLKTAPGIKERFQHAELDGKVSGFPLPLGSKRRQLSGNHFMLLGDAGHLIDPFTGEGISNAMISARHAAAVAKTAIDNKAFSADQLREYDRRVFNRLGQELQLSHRLQQLAQRPSLFNWVVNKALRSEELQRSISSMFDDIDLREQLRRPSFYWKVLWA